MVAVIAASNKRNPATSRAHVSRKSPNSRGRKRTAQGPRGIQAGDRREICPAILYHKFGRRNCPDISLRGAGADRTEAGTAFDLQPPQEEVFDAHELLRAGRRDGRAGASADSPDSA